MKKHPDVIIWKNHENVTIFNFEGEKLQKKGNLVCNGEMENEKAIYSINQYK